MTVQRVLQYIGGKYIEYVAAVVGGVVAAAGQLVALDGTGRLDNSIMPVGIGADTVTVPASEALSAGALVNIWNNPALNNGNGGPAARNADGSTTGKEAGGFVLAAVPSGAAATVYLSGQNTAQTGLTAGSVYLSDTAVGQVTATAPTAAGHVAQRVGTVVSATAYEFKPSDPVTRA